MPVSINKGILKVKNNQNQYINVLDGITSDSIGTIVTNAHNTITDTITEYISNNNWIIPIENGEGDSQPFISLNYETPDMYDDLKINLGDNKYDYTPCIQKAIDVASAKGSTVQLRGKYYCNSTIYCNTNTILIGCGDGRTNFNNETQIISTANPAILIGGPQRTIPDINGTNISQTMRGHTSIKDIKIITGFENDFESRRNQVGVQIESKTYGGGSAWKNYLENCTIRSFGIGIKFTTCNGEDTASENLFVHCKIFSCVIGVLSENYMAFNNTFIQTDIESAYAPIGPAIDIAHGGGFNFYGCSIMKRGPIVRIRRSIQECIVNIDSCRIEHLSNSSTKIYQQTSSTDWDGYTDPEDGVFVYPYLFGVVNPIITIAAENNTLTANVQGLPTQYTKSVRSGSGNNVTVTPSIWNVNIEHPYHYQWQQRNSLTNNQWQDIEEATNNTYTITSSDSSTSYRCRIKNGQEDVYYNTDIYPKLSTIVNQGNSKYYTGDIFEYYYNNIQHTNGLKNGRSITVNCLLNVSNTFIYLHNDGYAQQLFHASLGCTANFNNIQIGKDSRVEDIVLTKLESIENRISRKKVPLVHINANNVYGVLPAKRDIINMSYIAKIKQHNVYLTKSPATETSGNGVVPVWQKIPIDYDICGYGALNTQIQCIKFGRNDINASLGNNYQNYAFQLPPYLTLVKAGIRHYGGDDSEVILYAVSDKTELAQTNPDNPIIEENTENFVAGQECVMTKLGQYLTSPIIYTEENNDDNNNSNNNPIITAEANTKVAKYKSIVITATAINTSGNVSYKWYRALKETQNWTTTTLSGYETDTLSFGATEARLSYQYRCAVTDDNGTWYSNSINIKYSDILANVEDAIFNDDITITVETPTTSNTVSYLWQFSNTPDNTNSWQSTSLSGADTDTLSFKANETRIKGRYYRCKITIDNEISYSDTINISWGNNISLISNTTGITKLGNRIGFNILTNYVFNNPSYQWQISEDAGNNWINIINATINTLTFEATKKSIKNKIYRCVITDDNSTNNQTVINTYYSQTINIDWDTREQATNGGYSEFYFDNDNKDLLLTGTKTNYKKGRYYLCIKKSQLCDVYLYYI